MKQNVALKNHIGGSA